MREMFEPWTPRFAAGWKAVEDANRICAQYQQQGLDLTLRQLYYRFVALDLFPEDRRWRKLESGRYVRDPNGTKNADPNYKWLGEIVTNARMGGLLDWNYIVDRTRTTYGSDGADDSPEDAILTTAGGYRRALWQDQPRHVEVWVEKEALAGVISQAASRRRAPYFACRGYTSLSAMKRNADRFASWARAGKPGYIIHLGDHDPSGIDMTRDIERRMQTFAGKHAPEVRRIALNMDQIEVLNPPPNPAKEGDSRTRDYIDEFDTDETWELDAIEPAALLDLIDTAVIELIDRDAWQLSREREARERAQMQRVSDQWVDVIDLVGEPDDDEMTMDDEEEISGDLDE